MDGEIFQRENITRVSAQYRHIERVNLLSDRLQKLILVGAVLSLIAAVVLTFLHCNGMVCTALAVVLLWIRPVSFLLRKKKVDGEIKTTFCEYEFVQKRNAETVRYRYDEIKSVRIFGNWIALKMRRKRILLDANGFVFLTTENLVEFLRKNYPKISVKKKKSLDARRYYRAFVWATIFSVVATTAAAYVRQSMDAPPPVACSNAKQLRTQIELTEVPSALKIWETEDIKFLAPASFVQQPSENGEFLLSNFRETTIRVLSAEKSDFTGYSTEAAIFTAMANLPTFTSDSTSGMPWDMPLIVTDEFGRMVCAYCWGSGITSETYAVFLETENRYVVVIYKGIKEYGSIDESDDFVEWSKMIYIK